MVSKNLRHVEKEGRTRTVFDGIEDADSKNPACQDRFIFDKHTCEKNPRGPASLCSTRWLKIQFSFWFF